MQLAVGSLNILIAKYLYYPYCYNGNPSAPFHPYERILLTSYFPCFQQR